MRRFVLLTEFALTLALVFATVGPTSTGAPVLRSAGADKGHVVVTFTLTRDLVPGSVLVAATRAGLTGPGPRVKLREAMHPSLDAATGMDRWRTRGSLPPGTYYVEVSGIQAVGITGCVPRRPDCLARWSNVRRIVVS